MKYFIDTNIFLRTLIKEDEKSFTECVRFLTALKQNKIKAVTGNIVLAEVAWTLSSYYQFSKKQVVQALKSIINLRGLVIKDYYDQGVALSLFGKFKVKYIDSLIASNKYLRQKTWTLISYDKDFDKLGILRKEPKEVIILKEN